MEACVCRVEKLVLEASSGENDFPATVWEDRDADENSAIPVQKRRERNQ
jgi:hypothetical protein